MQKTTKTNQLAGVLFLMLAQMTGFVGAEDGYQPLFNGKDFDDWNLLLRDGTPDEMKKVYTIDANGILHVFRDLPDGYGTKTRKNATHGVMATQKSNYSLKFEYKWGKKLLNNCHQYQYDAGMFYHITELKVFPVGMQYQVRYNHIENRNHSGDFIGSGVNLQWYSKDGKTFEWPQQGGEPQPKRRGQHYAHTSAPFYGLGDTWNECEIIVMGDQYALHKLNGQIVNMATDLETSEGPIAVEVETGEILWRNIRIKEFDKPVPMEIFLGSQSTKSRLIVMADMGNEPDEEQQIMHLLICSNEIEI